MPNGMLEI